MEIANSMTKGKSLVWVDGWISEKEWGLRKGEGKLVGVCLRSSLFSKNMRWSGLLEAEVLIRRWECWQGRNKRTASEFEENRNLSSLFGPSRYIESGVKATVRGRAIPGQHFSLITRMPLITLMANRAFPCACNIGPKITVWSPIGMPWGLYQQNG